MSELEDLIDVVLPDELQDLVEEYKAAFGASPNIWRYRADPAAASKAITKALETDTPIEEYELEKGDVL